MAIQALIPGVGYVEESATVQALVPGAGYVNETVSAGSNQTVAPAVGHLALAGKQPTLVQTANRTIVPAVGHLTLAGKQPTLVQTANRWIVPAVGHLTLTGQQPTLVQTQAGRPASDVDATGWTPSTPGALYAMIDETVVSDTDYIYTTTENADCEVALSALSDPYTGLGHVVKYRARSLNGEQCKISLVESTTIRAEWTDVLTTEFLDYSHELSEVQANAITNYADLRLRFTALAA
jgi:hypothetical protein